MHIRKMTTNDIPSIRRIGIATPELSVNEDDSSFWDEKRLTDWINGDQDVMLVAEIDNIFAGFQITNVSVSARIGYLSDLAVDENYRGQGVGSALVEETLKIMKQQGITYVYTLTQANNIKIHTQLNKYGFKRGKQMVWFDKTM